MLLNIEKHTIDSAYELHVVNKKYVDDNLGGKKLIYLTEAEYNALPEEEKNLDNVVYNIIME